MPQWHIDVRLQRSFGAIPGFRRGLDLLICEIVSTWFYCGRVSQAPGTVGSAAALPFFPLVVSSATTGFVLFCSVFFVGILSVAGYLRQRPGVDDPREVVVDEVCGQLLVFVIISACAQGGLDIFHRVGGICGMLCLALTGLISFRVFDIAKPWPISVIDKDVKGALGVMLDDVAAAIPAAIVTLAVASVG